MPKKNCPTCNLSLYSVKGSHSGSLRCKLEAIRWEHEKNGYLPIDKSHHASLTDRDFKIYEGTAYKLQRYGTLYLKPVLYIPSWAVYICKASYLLVRSNQMNLTLCDKKQRSYIGKTREVTNKVFMHIKENDGFEVSIDSAFRLGGIEFVKNIIKTLWNEQTQNKEN